MLAENPRFAVVEVADNGPGIAKTVRPRLFESFFTTKGDEQGTGLGLAVSRELARGAGGDLTLLDEAVGWPEPAITVFRLTLPVSPGAVMRAARGARQGWRWAVLLGPCWRARRTARRRFPPAPCRPPSPDRCRSW